MQRAEERAARPPRAEAEARAARLGRPVLLSTSRRIAAVDAIAWFAAAHARSRVLWLRPADGVGIAAHGSVATFEAGLERAAAAWRQLMTDAVIDGAFTAGAGGPVLLGGVAFDPLRAPTRLWRGFPASRFVLPSEMLFMRGETVWLTDNELVGAERVGSERDSSELFGAKLPRSARQLDPLAPELEPLSRSDWETLVGSTAAGIRDGSLGVQKLVLARSQRIVAPRPFDIQQALRRLAEAYPTCSAFAFAEGDATFLGATPERLVSLHNGVASSMALAASIRRGESPAEDDALRRQLLDSPKERAEHAIVLGALRDSLSQVCSTVVADAEPRIESLPNVQHLLTRVRGQVRPGTSVLEVVQALHPTPAVGGFPRQRALDLLRQTERLDRGWYAGALGWVDARGDGEFVVGLRSALVRGQAATLFAGCGIVADSDPRAEYVESEWKLRPMLAALGGD